VFTPGSANLHAREFFRTAVDACLRLGRRGMLLTRFVEQVPAELPATVRHFAYVPLTPLLPRCAALVHHGGIGTAAQAMAAGVPQLIMALAHDQFDNADRVQRLGLGDWLTPFWFRGPRVARKLAALLDSPATQSACRAVAQRLSRRGGIEQTAQAIEAWTERRANQVPAAAS
jgi:UDP:flavonoid glycosyltransferase YjiC (YdhE family)